VKTINPVERILNETIFTNFGLVISIAAGFIFSMTIRTGKPDIDLSLFFLYFNNVVVSYLIIRVGISLLAYVRKVKGQ